MSTTSRVAAMCLLFATPLLAQETQPTAKEPVRVGIGVSLNPAIILIPTTGFLPFGISNFLIPIKVGKTATLEPEIGIFRTSEEQGGTTQSLSSWRVGLGVLFDMKTRDLLTPYAGARFGFSRTKEDDSATETTQSSWFMGAVLGAQHFFSPHFSLGGEIQLVRTSIGDADVSPAPPFPIPESSQSAISTSGLVILRWFF